MLRSCFFFFSLDFFKLSELMSSFFVCWCSWAKHPCSSLYAGWGDSACSHFPTLKHFCPAYKCSVTHYSGSRTPTSGTSVIKLCHVMKITMAGCKPSINHNTSSILLSPWQNPGWTQESETPVVHAISLFCLTLLTLGDKANTEGCYSFTDAYTTLKSHC